MCIIIDANMAAALVSATPSDDLVPIIDWLFSSGKSHGILVVGGRLADELGRIREFGRFFRVLSQAGRARVLPSDQVDSVEAALARNCASNDAHIIAIARLSGARLLCSHDTALHADFTSPILLSRPRGHVYQTCGHRSLIMQYGHTSACGHRRK